MLGIALITAGCGAGTPGQAFMTPEGFARSGMSIARGATAVIGLGDLKLADPGVPVKLVSSSVAGDQIGPQAGRVLGVKVYRFTDSGGIGAITEADLSGADGNGGWQLESPTGAVVTDEESRWAEPCGSVSACLGCPLAQVKEHLAHHPDVAELHQQREHDGR